MIFLALPASIGLILLREPVITMLYQRGEFDERDMARVVRGLLGRLDPLPEALVDALVRTSAGSPRLAEENVRLLIQRGLV